MRPHLPRHPAALLALPLLAAAGAAASTAGAQQDTAPAASLLPAPSPALGADLEAAGAALQRRRAAREERAAGTLRFPVDGRADVDLGAGRFGDDRGSHTHQGQDVFAPAGTPVRAIADSVVVEVGGGDARGNHVALYDARRGRTYAYFHLQAPPTVREGQRVRAGRRLGRVGCTGRCWGDHLHLEVHAGRSAAGRALDPLALLRRARRAA